MRQSSNPSNRMYFPARSAKRAGIAGEKRFEKRILKMPDRINEFVIDTSGSRQRVLVPVTLQALVVTQSYMANAEWSIVPTSYSNMRDFMPPVEPEPFTPGQLNTP